MRIGDLEISRGEEKEGVKEYHNALGILEELSVSDPINADIGRILALGYRKVGGAQEETNPGEALNNYAKAGAINERLMKADPNNAQASMSLAITLRFTGDLQAKRGDLRNALANYERVLQILERLAAGEPRNILLQGRHAEVLVSTSDLLARNGRLDEARRMAARGLAITRELASRGDSTPDDLYQYAEIFLTCTRAELREPATALAYMKRAVEKSGGTDSDILDLLAEAYFQNRKITNAIESEEKALRLLPPANGQAPLATRRHKMELRLAKFKTAQKHR